MAGAAIGGNVSDVEVRQVWKTYPNSTPTSNAALHSAPIDHLYSNMKLRVISVTARVAVSVALATLAFR
jgi:hypothetical protein